jgi:hypothetical protein
LIIHNLVAAMEIPQAQKVKYFTSWEQLPACSPSKSIL